MLMKKGFIRKMILKKDDGSLDFHIIALVFLILIISLTLMKIEERKVYYLKSNLDNAVVLSTMSANVADIYEFATFNIVYLDATDSSGKISAYGKNTEVEMSNGIKIAYQNAYNRFKKALKVNMNRVTNYKVDEFKIYNVSSSKICSFDGATYKYEGVKGSVKSPTGDVINCSGIYSKVTVPVTAMGQGFTIEINEFVDTFTG